MATFEPSLRTKGAPHPGQAAEGAARPEAPPDPVLFRELTDRFTVLAEACARFSQEVYRRAGTSPAADIEGTIRRNLKIARTVFGKWSLEILAVAYLNKSIGVADLRKALGRITAPHLSMKLRALEKMGLIQRDVISRETPETAYSLTHKGLMIARLGEPVFLYLRLADGWRQPAQDTPPPAERQQPQVPTAAVDA